MTTRLADYTRPYGRHARLPAWQPVITVAATRTARLVAAMVASFLLGIASAWTWL